MKNQREEEGEDRISQLPQALLHELLSYLTYLDPKEAVKTCVLSKSWRDLVSTNPNVCFKEEWFTGENKKEAFWSFVVTTLQRYQDQKLPIENFCLEMSEVDSESKTLLEKWVPRVLLNMGVKSFSIFIKSETSAYFDLPSEVFTAQLPLEYLFLTRCMLSQINNISIVDNVVFKHLEILHLWRVYIADETFEKIILCCPCLADLKLDYCYGFEEIKLSSSSIDRLTITGLKESVMKVTIHTPNILYFNYNSQFLPSSSFSFTTAPGHVWKSEICLYIGEIEDSSCFFKLNEVLRALSQSEISLEIYGVYFYLKNTYLGGLNESVAVENLILGGSFRRAASFKSFLTMLFRVCHPRNINTCTMLRYCVHNQGEDEELNKLLGKFLLQKRKGRAHYFSEPDLVEVRMELFADDGEENPYYVEKSSSFFNEPKTMFRLKWKEKS